MKGCVHKKELRKRKDARNGDHQIGEIQAYGVNCSKKRGMY